MDKKKRPKRPELWEMLVSIAAFICNVIILIFIYRSDDKTRAVIITLSPVLLALSLLVPVIAKAFAYGAGYSSRIVGVPVAAYIRKYKLTGWIKGKYLFLDALMSSANYESETAFEQFRECLEKTQDKRLRKACYSEMKNIRNFNGYMRMLPFMLDACREFPEEKQFFDWCAGYYIWFDQADEGEGSAWFKSVADSGADDSFKAVSYYYLGVNRLYNLDYTAAESYLEKALRLTSHKHSEQLLDLAVCKACLKKYDEARKYAVQSAAVIENSEELGRIEEKFGYLFKALEGEINPDIEKLAAELRRRREYSAQNSVRTEDITDLEKRIEQARK